MKTQNKMKRRVALVDDDSAVRDALRQGLEQMGDFQVVADCASGDDVLERWTSLPPWQRPEIVLLEISLKRGDGFHCCRELRRLLPDLVIALHTTHRLPCFVSGARHADADAYFRKPADLHQLAAELSRLHRTEGMLLGPGVLLGGVTGSLVLAREPQFQGKEEQVLELEAAGLCVGEISAKLGLHEQTIYRILRTAMERVRAATQPFESSGRIRNV